MNIPREFSPKVLDRVIPKADNENLFRTPLHIDYPERAGADLVPATPLDRDQLDNPELFNAVGSRIENTGVPCHWPIIDADGGAMLQAVPERKSKLIIKASGATREESTAYGPKSLLRDILGDNGFDLEVFQEPQETWGQMLQSYQLAGQRVTAIVLRSEKRILDVAESTTPGRSHVYIQKGFTTSDHETLISELGSLGIISPRWQELVETAGMGIVRTPWTEKDVTHPHS